MTVTALPSFLVHKPSRVRTSRRNVLDSRYSKHNSCMSPSSVSVRDELGAGLSISPQSKDTFQNRHFTVRAIHTELYHGQEQTLSC